MKKWVLFFPLLLILPFYLVSLVSLWGSAMESIAVKDTPKGIKSILGEDNLAKIQEEYAIPMSVRLEVLGLFERMTIGSATSVALYEDVLKAGLRSLISIITTKLLRWY